MPTNSFVLEAHSFINNPQIGKSFYNTQQSHFSLFDALTPNKAL